MWKASITTCVLLLAACHSHTKVGGGDDGDGGSGGDGGSSGTLSISPQNATVNTTVGTTATLAFIVASTASALPPSGTFSLDNTAIGSIDPDSGMFTANGIVGGSSSVQFVDGNAHSVSTSVTVKLSTSVGVIAGGGPMSPDTLFNNAGTPVTDTTAQANILYPLDHVVFPQNTTAPNVQWQIASGTTGTGGASDWYRITYTKLSITVTSYVQNTSTFQFASALPNTVIASIAQSDPTVEATLQIDRLDVAGARVVSGAPIHLKFASGSISGTVYYWSLDEHLIRRIPAGVASNQRLFPPNIVGTGANSSFSYGGCIACHSISRDGRYLLASGGDLGEQSLVFDLTAADPTQMSMPVTTRSGYQTFFSTLSPDNTRIFSTTGAPTFSYTDLSLTNVTPTGTVPSGAVAHPSWSPDGKMVAYISNVAGWQSDASFTGGDLTTVQVNAATDVFSGLQVLHQGASLMSSDPAGGSADCFPSFTPDSKFLVFAHTPNTRTGTDNRAPGSLYMMAPTMGGTPVRLATATDSASMALSHFPNMSPFISGGYYWIVFYSTRDYGNALVGTKGSTRPQLWVSAISTSFDGTTDPSSVPYWLPGQDTAAENADAVWAAAACSATGDSCLTSSDCCSGACLPSGDGGFSCTAPQTCRREGESCATTADCCGGTGLVCDMTIHACQKQVQ